MAARKQSKGMQEVNRYRRYMQTAADAIDDNDIEELLGVVAQITGQKFHNPFWAGVVALGVGRLLMRSAFTPLRRLGWSLLGFGAANTAGEAVSWGLNVAEQIGRIRKSWQRPEGQYIPPSGGIGEP